MRFSFLLAIELLGLQILAACSSGQARTQTVPLGLQSLHRAQATETVLYRFGSQQPDGLHPSAGLAYANGTFYGVTTENTANRNAAAFSMTPSGAETFLHQFTRKQGAEPLRSLTPVGVNHLNLYGAAYQGGTYGYGTVYAITPAHRVKVLHDFTFGSDGGCPATTLLNMHRTLYGTTFCGGAHGDGTVFSITPAGIETVLYSFAGGKDGEEPYAGLTRHGSVLYGTTYGGGFGFGTIFSVSTSGAEHVLHTFRVGVVGDGEYPETNLVALHGALYGTTYAGGANGNGAVFKITPSGEYTLLYSFANGGDGVFPNGLVAVNGVLYGTTFLGGTSGYGTVFSITPQGTETVLYSFGGGSDGSNPDSPLIDVNGTLYGTTYDGGGYGKSGGGTIYSITL